MDLDNRRKAIIAAGVGVGLVLVLVLGVLIVAISCQGAGGVSGPGGCRIDAQKVADVSIPDGTRIQPGAAFDKTWRIKNNGTCAWENGTQLVYQSGDTLGGPAFVAIPSLAANATTDVSVHFVAPEAVGQYRASWQLQGPSGAKFGPELQVAIQVSTEAGGTPGGPGASGGAEASATPAPAATPAPTPSPSPTPTPAPTPTPLGGGLGKIAFLSNRDGKFHVWMMGPHGDIPVQITSGSDPDTNVNLSPDGSKIVFERSVGGKPDIMVANADGSGLVNVTNSPAAYDTDPVWSPDGTKIAFASDRAGGALQVWVMKANGTGLTKLTNTAQSNDAPAWSPDGSYIAFESSRTGSAEIWIMKPDGSAQTRLTTTGGNYMPAFSPDSGKIAFSRGDGIYAMKKDGSAYTRLTTDVSALILDMHPAYSPNGQYIAFDTSRSGNQDIWIMKADGTGMSQMAVNPAGDMLPSWV